MSRHFNMKLEPSWFDMLFRKNRYKRIIELREQCSFMLKEFDDVDIFITIAKYESIKVELFDFIWMSFNKVSMYEDLGEQAVIGRLTSDRSKILKILSVVKEIDLSSIQESIREEKLKTVFDD